ncbi:MAG: GNAT family N-acetyltransferase [bacterium]
MLTFRPYRPEDEQQCVELLQSGHDPAFSVERFRWLHFRNPLAPSVMVLGFADERLVGLYSAIKKRVVLDGRVYIIGRDVDPVVHPSQRGRGVFSQLLTQALAANQDIDFYCNFANRLSAPGFLKHGWSAIGSLADHVFQTGARSPLTTEFLYYLLTGARSWRCSPGDVREKTASETAMLLPGNAAPVAGRCGVERSAEYLSWRYFTNPLISYRYFLRFAGEALAALLIVREFADSRTALVMELVSFTSDPARIDPFLTVLKCEFPKYRLKTWSTMPAPARRYFRSNFLKRGQGQPFFVRPAPGRELPPAIFELNSWLVTHGDSEFL